MPDDKKDKRYPKEQRKPRHGRQQATAEKKIEKKEEPKSAPKVSVPAKPEYNDPGPEFYKSLKRETDEILKITEEENTKYKKKEIQSNWSKYEMPIQSYEEIEEQENLGADYEKLIQAPLSAGGHFQFKHEKSWDLNTAPSLYDNYFEFDMDNLSVALSTIPFYERNTIDKSIFTDSDILSMNNRATRFKQKYYNNKSYATPEAEASDKILNSLRDTKSNENKEINPATDAVINNMHKTDDKVIKNVNQEEEKKAVIENMKEHPTSIIMPKDTSLINTKEDKICGNNLTEKRSEANETSEIKLSNIKQEVTFKPELQVPKLETNFNDNTLDLSKSLVDSKDFDDIVFGKVEEQTSKNPVPTEPPLPPAAVTVSQTPEPKKNPIIESPEDLEKWLDDFLDG